MQLTNSAERPIVWQPIPNSSQELALDSRCNDTLYTGSRGPGKSDTQLMRFRRRVGIGYGSFWRGIIFDREYKHLDDLISKSKRWFYKFNDGAEWLAATSSLKWVWPTGEELLFRVIKDVHDYDNYHGQEYPFIGWNELTKYPNPILYDMMMSCNRSSFTPEKDAPINRQTGARIYVPPIPLEVFSTCNSYGPGHSWVKQRFIDVAPYGEIVRKTVHVFNPRTQQEEDVTRTQVTIFGSYKENIYLDPIYVAGLTENPDENLKKSWLDGSWDVVAGGALDDVWIPKLHIVPRFQVPETWYLDRTLDWGSTHPFSVGWWAEANGEEAELLDGSVFCPAPGSLIQCGEWYGTKCIGTNKGLKMSGTDVAIGIREREEKMLANEWILDRPQPGPADNQITYTYDSDNENIEFKMAKKDVRWQKSDKSKGSRINGLELIRERLKAAKNGEEPALYFMEHCRASIATLPILPRDEVQLDDVDTTSEDHPYDMVRYRVLKGAQKYAAKVKVKWVN